MKNRIPLYIASLSFSFVFGISLMAQEKTEVSVQVKKDGKVVKDTTYQFEDEAEAEHAIQIMEVLSGEEKHMEHSKTMVWVSEDDHPHGEHVLVVKSGDGETFDILIDEDELHEAHENVFISDDDENVYVIKGDGEDVHKEIEVIIKEHGDGENVKVIVIKKDGDYDHDHDHDEDVEVEVTKKKEKK